ncbi:MULTISPECIES: hypothetical protein [Bradyrhizobium]|nr:MULTISPECIES: hypothetical protein [Bradyrhizobium]UWU67038.1 hypothetical protein N2602_27840 [Bradyrhizobium sp. NC92]
MSRLTSGAHLDDAIYEGVLPDASIDSAQNGKPLLPAQYVVRKGLASSPR